jgi:ParB-like chromosome segregation protein Spo0J
MAEPVKVGFERSIAVLPISALLPLKAVPDEIKQSVKFKQIARSVSEVGIIEPLVVARSEDQKGKYLLLDGHMRHAVLSDIAVTEVHDCAGH